VLNMLLFICVEHAIVHLCWTCYCSFVLRMLLFICVEHAVVYLCWTCYCSFVLSMLLFICVEHAINLWIFKNSKNKNFDINHDYLCKVHNCIYSCSTIIITRRHLSYKNQVKHDSVVCYPLVNVCCITSSEPFFQLYHGENKWHSMRWWWGHFVLEQRA